MESVDNVIFRVTSEIRGKSEHPDEARIYNFVKDFLDDSGLSDGSFWEKNENTWGPRSFKLKQDGKSNTRKKVLSFFCENHCTKQLIIIQILWIPPL